MKKTLAITLFGLAMMAVGSGSTLAWAIYESNETSRLQLDLMEQLDQQLKQQGPKTTQGPPAPVLRGAEGRKCSRSI